MGKAWLLTRKHNSLSVFHHVFELESAKVTLGELERTGRAWLTSVTSYLPHHLLLGNRCLTAGRCGAGRKARCGLFQTFPCEHLHTSRRTPVGCIRPLPAEVHSRQPRKVSTNSVSYVITSSPWEMLMHPFPRMFWKCRPMPAHLARCKLVSSSLALGFSRRKTLGHSHRSQGFSGLNQTPVT